MKITPEAWKRIEPLLTAALEMAPAGRAAWLQRVQAQDPEAASRLSTLLAAHDRAERSREMETIPRLAESPASLQAPADLVGPYRLLRLLGRGGMGEVWLAEQADGRVTREVALKLPTGLGAGDILAERFRRERDILAKLAHPNIARLYDAGVTDAGQPYLAMEYVEGEALDEHVARRNAPLPERIALFRQVLGAVGHAHRHLVVHRDLKPANVLIDRFGQVKLLDFGIAKLLRDQDTPPQAGQRDITRLGGRVMTLRYAAPEQVAEAAISTATDIYSLGVMLHELLTGASPYRALREGRRLTDRMLLEDDVALPSTLARDPEAARSRGMASPRHLARRLAGDLDAILLKALRHDPAERYASVELFDEDLARHMQRRPVAARAGTWRYLAGRFAARHRVPIALMAAVVFTLAAGLVVADRERQRAETHFASVRKLANTFIFEVHAQIEHLPGSLKARETLVKTALEYLDALLRESAGDPALMYELAAAYRRVGNIQGEPGAANTGDLAAAIANFQKAKGVHLALAERNARDIGKLREHANLSYALARAYVLAADARWQEEIAHTVRLAEQVAALPGATLNDRARVGNALSEQAHLTSLIVGQGPAPEAAAARAVSLLEALAAENPGDFRARQILASVHMKAGGILLGSARTATTVRQAIHHFRRAGTLFAGLLAEAPGDQRMPANVLEADYYLAKALAMAGELEESARIVEASRRTVADLSARDPDNAELVSDHVRVLGQAALVSLQRGEPSRAVRLGREALAMHARLPEGARSGSDARRNLADAQGFTALALLASAQEVPAGDPSRLAALREARAMLAEALAFIEGARPAMPGSFNDEDTRVLQDALRSCEEAIARHAPAG